MSFIHKFLDIAEPIPRKIVRLLKLLKETEEISANLKKNLQKKREQYLQNLREKAPKKNITLKSLKILHKELISLSDYKLELIKEMKYIIDTTFLKNVSPIILEGKNEVQQKQLATNMNKINIPIPYNNININNTKNVINNKIILDDDKKLTEIKTIDTELSTTSVNLNNTNKLLSKKKYRTKNNKKIKEEFSTENSNKFLENIKLDVYCKCKKGSYGKMIQCDNPECADWFHYGCIGIKEGFEPEEWYCSPKCKENAKKMKHKISRLKKIC